MDWLNVTFPGADASIGGLLAFLKCAMGRPVSAEQGGGLLGFEEGYRLYAHVGSRRVACGFVARGGEAQRGRWLLQLTGTGCAFVLDWRLVRDTLDALDARITRLDLALDFLEGGYTVDEAVEAYKAGDFTSNGRPPSCSVAGDWITGAGGRTFYVGKAKNGKLLRVYEKGAQLGRDDAKEWVRVEVQLGNRDRTIPLDALIECDAYFAGSYPMLAELVTTAAKQVPTYRAAGLVALSHLVHHMRRAYGRVLDVMVGSLGCSPSALVEECRIVGIPRRVNPSSLGAGVDPADVLKRAKE